jgi:flagellar biosynthesis regulator FlbT
LSRSNLNAFHEEQRRILFLFKIVSLIENVSNRDTVNELKQYDDQINSTKIFDAHISNELD